MLLAATRRLRELGPQLVTQRGTQAPRYLQDATNTGVFRALLKYDGYEPYFRVQCRQESVSAGDPLLFDWDLDKWLSQPGSKPN